MKKKLVILLAAIVSVVMVGSFSLIGCKAEEEAVVEEEVAEEEAVVEEVVEEEAAETTGKFREVPLDWILDLEEELAVPWTPGGPEDEPVLGAAQLILTTEQIEVATDLELKDYYFMAGTLDATETLNKIGMDEVLASVGKAPIPFMGAGSISEQMDQVATLTSKATSISFLVAQGWDAVTMGPAFVELSEAGVPQVHNWTTPAGLYDSANYIGLVDADGYGQGAAAAEILAYAMNYEGEVGIIYFALEQWTNVMRLQGAEDTFAEYPDIEVVAREGFTDPAEGYDIAVGMLQAHPEIDAVWATWMMGPATGAAEAVTALGKAGEVIVAAPDLGGITGANFIADPDYPIIGCGEADCIEMGENSIRAALKWVLGLEEEVGKGYFVSRTYPIVRANLIDGFYKTSRGTMGDLPREVLDLLED